MELVERGAVLAGLGEAVVASTQGHGSLTFIAGEAGLGKTSVVHALLGRHDADLRAHVGGCDALSTPRPLGPLRDMARNSQEIAQLFELSARHELFAGLLDHLSTPGRPAIVVLEDVHWADAATLDLLRYLGRRADRTYATILATYRSDEVSSDHPLRAVLGDLATVPAVRRQSLRPLSREGVAHLAEDAGLDPDELYGRTGGNPFFVSEVLADPSANLPENVRDAVLARAQRLDPDARRVLQVVSVVPRAMERWLLTAVADPDPSAIDACVEVGMLGSDDHGQLSFRHELARLALEAALPPAERGRLHSSVMQALIDRGAQATVDPARIVHHADRAGEGEVVLRFAREAAELAAQRGAIRQAHDHLSRALSFADLLPDDEHAELLERYADTTAKVGDMAAAVAAADQAVTLRRKGDDQLALGAAIRLRAGVRWDAGRSPESHADIQQALEILRPCGETVELAQALAAAVTVAMLARDYDTALAFADEAIELAEQTDALIPLSRTLNSVGSVEILIGQQQEGEAHLRRSIDVARRARDLGSEAVALSNLGSGSGEVRRYEPAERYLEKAIAFGRAHDLDSSADYATAWLARVRFETGRWQEAAELASSLPLDRPGISPIITITALTALGRLRARRGDPGVAEALDRAWALALETDDLQRLWPAAAARGEAAVLAGDDELAVPMVGDIYARAVEVDHPWAIGELGALLWRGRALDGSHREAFDGGAAEPYRLQVAGHCEEAAAAWERIGCPYERADALSEGDEEHQREALVVFDMLGAAPAAARLRQRMREAGIRSIPRGPRPATADHPAGLTPREAEVLELVAEGMTNAQIATELFISAKTAGHHVSSILGKLGVSTRDEAADRHRALKRATAGRAP